MLPLWEREDGTFPRKTLCLSFFTTSTARAARKKIGEVAALDGGQNLKFDFNVVLVSIRRLYPSTVTIAVPFPERMGRNGHVYHFVCKHQNQ